MIDSVKNLFCCSHSPRLISKNQPDSTCQYLVLGLLALGGATLLGTGYLSHLAQQGSLPSFLSPLQGLEGIGTVGLKMCWGSGAACLGISLISAIWDVRAYIRFSKRQKEDLKVSQNLPTPQKLATKVPLSTAPALEPAPRTPVISNFTSPTVYAGTPALAPTPTTPSPSSSLQDRKIIPFFAPQDSATCTSQANPIPPTDKPNAKAEIIKDLDEHTRTLKDLVLKIPNHASREKMSQKMDTICRTSATLISDYEDLELCRHVLEGAKQKFEEILEEIKVLHSDSKGKKPIPSKEEMFQELDALKTTMLESLGEFQDATIQIDIAKHIESIVFQAKQKIEDLNDEEKGFDLFEKAQEELSAISTNMEDLKNVDPLFIQHLNEKLSKVSEESTLWQKDFLDALRNPTTLEAIGDLFHDNDFYLNQNFTHFFGGSAFHHLAKYSKYLEVLKLALSQDLNYALQDFFGNTPLMWAIANANNGAALMIIKNADSGALNVQCKQQNTALHLAVGKGYTTHSRDGAQLPCSNLQLIDIMILKNVNVNLRNKEGNTPLHLACLRRDQGMIEALLKAGADVEMRNSAGQTPLDCLSVGYDQAEVVLKKTVSAYLLDKQHYDQVDVKALTELIIRHQKPLPSE